MDSKGPGPSVEELGQYVTPMERPTLEKMKRDAQQLKTELRARGIDAKHTKVLEATARANGFRTWAAALVNAPAQ